jgi:hypothetical protein
MLGNADVGGGAGDPTDMASILDGNACDPRSTKWETIAVAAVRCVDTFLHNSCKQFHKSLDNFSAAVYNFDAATDNFRKKCDKLHKTTAHSLSTKLWKQLYGRTRRAESRIFVTKG